MNCKPWYLKKLNLFKSLSQKELEHISSRFVDKEFGKRQVIFEPQDKDKIFILQTGRVEIYELTSDGKKIIIDVLGPGSIFGDLGISEPTEYFVEATADSYACIMNKNEFFNVISKNPNVASILVRELLNKVVEFEKQVAALASDNLVTKVKNLLFRLAKRHGEERDDSITITAKFTHEQLADMVGISRPTMTELLNKLEKNGVIKKEGKTISFDPRRFENF